MPFWSKSPGRKCPFGLSSCPFYRILNRPRRKKCPFQLYIEMCIFGLNRRAESALFGLSMCPFYWILNRLRRKSAHFQYRMCLFGLNHRAECALLGFQCALFIGFSDRPRSRKSALFTTKPPLPYRKLIGNGPLQNQFPQDRDKKKYFT